MRKVIPMVLGVLLLAAACGGGGEEVAVSERGERPTGTTTSTTTTTLPVTTTTLPLAITDVPDVSDLGLTWDEPLEVDPVTGQITLTPFNAYLYDEAPIAMLPEGSFVGLDEDQTDVLLELALPAAPAKAVTVLLGLEPGDPSVQMLTGPAGGPEATRVVVIRNDEDDSIRALRWEFVVTIQDRDQLRVADVETEEAEEGLEGAAEEEAAGDTESQETPEGVQEEVDTQEPGDEAEAGPRKLIPIVTSGQLTFQCQPGRGHQDFATGLCV